MFGDAVRELRKERRWTQQELADMIGVSRTAITMLETTNSESPHYTTICQYAEAFGISPEEMIQRAKITDGIPRYRAPAGSIRKDRSHLKVIPKVCFDRVAFATAINQHCLKENLSLRDAAIISRISASTLSRIEKGEIPNLETFGQICEWLRIDPREFFYAED